MHPVLERLLSEDESARAGVDAARSTACAQLDVVRADLAHQREARLQELRRDLDQTVAQILADAESETDRRRTLREAHAREVAARTAALVERGAELWMQVIRERQSSEEAP